MDFEVNKKYSQETKDFVNHVIKYLRGEDMMKNVDSCSLEILCHYYEAFTIISKKIFEDGFLVEKPNGSIEENPLTKKLNDIEIQLFKILQEYGLTPLSRKRLKIESDKSDDSPLGNFFK